MKQQRKEDAVSPVIGVMLMLVVTIIIAAVITGFATDLSADTSTTPMAFFEIDYVDIYEYDWTEGEETIKKKAVNEFGIAHKGGDAIPLKDIQITYVTDSGGSMGLLNILETEQISILGNTDETMVTTGDIIKVTPKDWADSKIDAGSVVTWTISHTKTGGVIAKGEFIALPM